MNNLKHYRENAKMTLDDLEERSGVERSIINRVERGTRDINGQCWKALAKALNVTVDELLGNT